MNSLWIWLQHCTAKFCCNKVRVAFSVQHKMYRSAITSRNWISQRRIVLCYEMLVCSAKFVYEAQWEKNRCFVFFCFLWCIMFILLVVRCFALRPERSRSRHARMRTQRFCVGWDECSRKLAMVRSLFLRTWKNEQTNERRLKVIEPRVCTPRVASSRVPRIVTVVYIVRST